MLFKLYVGNACLLRDTQVTTIAANTPSVADFDKLEWLGDFQNFKNLGDTLTVHFGRQINFIFGTNGSGKSSVCDALKLLATREKPVRPLNNVHEALITHPTFSYKFANVSKTTWTTLTGYGPRNGSIKYFDTSIDIRNTTVAVEPGRIIELSPFRLHIFETAKKLTTAFRDKLRDVRVNHDNDITLVAQGIRMFFSESSLFPNSPLTSFANSDLHIIEGEIALGESFTDGAVLTAKTLLSKELEKATSAGGLALIREEKRGLDKLLFDINKIADAATALWAIDPLNTYSQLQSKLVEQETISRALVPTQGTLEQLIELLHKASPLCNLENAEGHTCPLCKRELTKDSAALFGIYHQLINGALEKEIQKLRHAMDTARLAVEVIDAVDLDAWSLLAGVRPSVLAETYEQASGVKGSCRMDASPSDGARTLLVSLRETSKRVSLDAAAKQLALLAALQGQEELLAGLTLVRAEIVPLAYASAVHDYLGILRHLAGLMKISEAWAEVIGDFPNTLRKLTMKAKEAYESLVVADFESRLENEYASLAEKSMAEFGVSLSRVGSEAAVTILPQIAGNNIDGVLSEGEQRIHALALFFAELETCSHGVLVFDDPISSFDYNYAENFANRLARFGKEYPERQIIVLTHSWECFMQLQQAVKRYSLQERFSLQVLENCCEIQEYSDKIEALKREISAIFAVPGPLSKRAKSSVAGKMRRLIESVVNTYVFNGERYQYKQKMPNVSTFDNFTQVTPLLPGEAIALRELFSKMSVMEHDDPTSIFVSADKVMYQHRFEKILQIADAVKARRP